MRTRILLGICVAAAAAFAPAGFAQGAVMVIGGGMARDCYEAVEYQRVASIRAIEICDLALEQERLSQKNRAATYVNRGILHMRDKRYQKSLDDFERGLLIDGNLLEAKINIGAALYGLKRYDEALAHLNEGVHAESADARATAYYNRALIYERQGNVEASYDDFRTALEIQPAFELAARQLERFTVVKADDS
jgi:tetratricopeptide (TPR) repeat protein